MGCSSPGGASSGVGSGPAGGAGVLTQGLVSRAGRAGGTAGALAGRVKTDAVPLTGADRKDFRVCFTFLM